jgi:ATP diphosphatase
LIDELLEIMARLRDPDGGCPWDLEQRFETIAPYTIEEAYEVDDAIRRGDWDALRDELGDLLLQVVFHAQMAREEDRFDFDSVVGAICDKLVRRHPHVFGDATVESADAQTDAWERQKRDERAVAGQTSAMDGVALALPALLRARKLVSRARRAGLDGSDAAPAADRASKSLDALRGALGAPDPPDAAALDAQFGALLFEIVRLAQQAGVEPEDALRAASAAYEADVRRREGDA